MILTILAVSFLVLICLIFRRNWLVALSASGLMIWQCISLLLDPGVAARRAMEKMKISQLTEDGIQAIQLYSSELHTFSLSHLILALGMFSLAIVGLLCNGGKNS